MTDAEKSGSRTKNMFVAMLPSTGQSSFYVRTLNLAGNS